MDYDEINPSELEVPEIPAIPEVELVLPIKTLVRLAYIFRGVFTQSVDGKPLQEIYDERGDYLLLADKVLNAWIDGLGLEFDYSQQSPPSQFGSN